MARPPDGTKAVADGKTGVVALVAAQENGFRGAACDNFFKEHGIKVRYRNASRAMALRRKTKVVGPGGQGGASWVWDSLEVDTARIGLQSVIAWLPRPDGPGRRPEQTQLLNALRATPGVLQIYDCFDDSIVILGAVVDVVAKRQLQSRLADLCPDLLWAEVRDIDFEQPARGWLQLAKAVAKTEELLEG